MLRIVTICLFLLLTGCGAKVDPEIDRLPIAAAWTADVQGMVGTEPAGFATITAMPDGGTRANLTLRGGATGGRQAWRIRVGRCPEGDSEPDPVGAEVGGGSEYPALVPNEGGFASGTASLGVALDSDAEYHLDVYETEDARVVVACGDLTRTS
ncbi:MAG TPA: hypothetical protein VIE68_02390 [Gemmatimonadota bacterium]|jgi:hypothetical protein